MSSYVVGIGGTGAKCVEALTHVCASGAGPAGNMYALFVDPDSANGNLSRAEQTLKTYVRCQQLGVGESKLWGTPIQVAEPMTWSPFQATQATDLDRLFGYYQLTLSDPAAANLFDVLYSPAEKRQPLTQGFRGHPSIGAAVMAKQVDLGNAEPWHTFGESLKRDVSNPNPTRILLIGSVFGGTGAAGIPTIARLIRDACTHGQVPNVEFGAVLALPYFNFLPVPESEGLSADPRSFLANTRAALQYYYNRQYLDLFSSVWVMGEQSSSQMNASVGSNTQRNRPHFLELYAASAAVSFFEGLAGNGAPGTHAYFVIGRHDESQLTWEDLPRLSVKSAGKDSASQLTWLKSKTLQMLRFAVSYLFLFQPMLEEIKKGQVYRAPWYIDFLTRSKLSIHDADVAAALTNVKSSCEDYLRWWAAVQDSVHKEDLDIQLVNQRVFTDRQDAREVTLKTRSQFIPRDFDKLLMPPGGAADTGLDQVWESLCDAKAGTGAEKVGKFLGALYQVCGK